jgi:aminoglycoside phosphotransferase (APT) family kinase protein
VTEAFGKDRIGVRRTHPPQAGEATASLGGGAAQGSSLKPPGRTVPQTWDRLADWLAHRGRLLNLDVAPRQFSGGLANLNYLVTVDGTSAVLRRPPEGPVAEGANDMRREARVLSGLAAHYPLAPRCLEFCDDVSVLGAPFQLLEFRAGVAIRAELPVEWANRVAAPDRLTSGLISAMVGLHALDPAMVGLGDLGRPDGFLPRQVEGWSRRCHAAYDSTPPAVATALIDRLRRLAPKNSTASLVHGDFKFDNMLVDVGRIEPVAVVDWDMATRADPLFDLAVLLSYWIEPDDPPELHNLRQVPSLQPGFMRRRQVAARYFAEAGRPAEDLSFHLALARLRLAVAWQQLYLRYVGGIFTDRHYAGFGRLAMAMLDWAIDTMDEDT